MSVPRLTRRLVLEQAQATPDGSGGHVENWVALGTLWAELRAGGGRVRPGEIVPVGKVPWRITVPAAAPGAPSRPRPGQRLREGERVFLVHAVAEADVRGAHLICFAEEEEPA